MTNRRLPTMQDGGHCFGLSEDSPDITVAGRTWPLWHCAHCYLDLPGWLLDGGIYDRCLRPNGRLALPPATHHRDPRRTRTP